MRGFLNLICQKRRAALLAACTLLIAISAGMLTLPAAPVDGPGAYDRQVSIMIARLMRRDHLLQRTLDDEISKRAITTYLESFDPRKLYFLQSDIDEFRQQETKLDDLVKRGQLDFAHDVYHRFIERLDERVKLVDELTKETFDFTKDEELVTDSDALSYPRNEDEVRSRWRKLVKYNLLMHRVDELDDEEARQKIRNRYHTVAKRYHQMDSDELLERFLSSVTTSYDPHTSYMSRSTLENFQISMRLELDGIGAALKNSEDGFTVVTKIIPGGAADKHGKLKVDDRIVSVSGPDDEMIDVLDMKLNDVVQLIRGKAGTVVRLGVKSAGVGPTKIYSITRERIQLEDSAAQAKVLERGQSPSGKPYKVGVIDLPSFYLDMEAAREDGGNGTGYRSTTRDVLRILRDFNEESVDVVVLDLRQNGGGSLTEAINLTGLFIDQGPVVQVKDANGRVQSYNDLDQGLAWHGPLVVLTSKFSASASEILAGAIQDYHRGLIIGDESTHGKGTVQSLSSLGSKLFPIPNPPNLGALKITMQQFYRPNGDSTQKRGVLPDIVLPSMTNLIGIGEADLDYAIEFDHVPRARFSAYGMVNKDLVSQLKQNSENRIRDSEEYAKELTRIQRYQKYKDEKTIPLNEQKYLARREAERDVEEEEAKQFDQTDTDEIFPDDFYNREVVSIVLDYLGGLDNKRVARAN